MADAPLTDYRGSCHCGAIKYSVKLPKLEKVSACNCSICSKKGYLWTFPSSDDDFVVEKGDGKWTVYEFGKKTTSHIFCPTCGTSIMGKRQPSGIGLNARTLEDIDIEKLEIGTFNGAAIEPFYEPPPAADTTTDDDTAAKVYHGSCHCKAVTVQVTSDPITEVTDCNCSICSRNAYLWIYPPATAVQIHGKENLQIYRFNSNTAGHSFCKTCGVSVVNQLAGARAAKFPVNVRVLNGFDLDAVERKKLNGKDFQI